MFKRKTRKKLSYLFILAGIYFVYKAFLDRWFLLGIAGGIHFLSGLLLFLDNRSTDNEKTGVR